MSATQPRLVRICAPSAEPGHPARTQGTVVMLADGTHLHGVTGIRLYAEVGDVWRADISLLCEAPDIGGVEATFTTPDKPSLLRRFWAWLWQDLTVDVTDLQSHDRRFGRR